MNLIFHKYVTVFSVITTDATCFMISHPDIFNMPKDLSRMQIALIIQYFVWTSG